MKRLFVFVCFLVFVAACTPMANENMTNANKGTEMKSTAPPSEADMIAKEKAAWDAFRKKDADAFKKMLAPDYIEVLDSGTKDTAESVAGMKDFELSDVTFADWKMTTVDKDALILTYSVKVKGTYQGKAVPEGPYREASAYVNRNGEWLAIYYQETLAQPEQPMPPPPPAKEGTKAASPMAKPAETGPDAAANEKLVWDALKTKNYDAFASYLASDSMEIEADGVYDKAGSVKGVQGIDLSKAELSDWKTVKFDDDASLVTYKVKVPGRKPDTEYHSTIWVKRDNKWQALFHMGTPA
ncbi:MAG TPA: nuclear transport factor 2 family protein, partial [Pyrinomonadaceae bacterium]|nr:nuclear transport factor 2 family protein [Pyrinomonadaceae bacterium]